MNHYHIYEAIGYGKYSEGRKKKTIEHFAIKSVDKSQCFDLNLNFHSRDLEISRGFRLQLHRFQDCDASDSKSLDDLFHCAYNHSLWVLNNYSVDESAAHKLKEICSDG